MLRLEIGYARKLKIMEISLFGLELVFEILSKFIIQIFGSYFVVLAHRVWILFCIDAIDRALGLCFLIFSFFEENLFELPVKVLYLLLK